MGDEVASMSDLDSEHDSMGSEHERLSQWVWGVWSVKGRGEAVNMWGKGSEHEKFMQ